MDAGLALRLHELCHVDGARDSSCPHCQAEAVRSSIERELITSTVPSLEAIPGGA